MIKFRLKQLMVEKEFKDGIKLSLSKIATTLKIGRTTLSQMVNAKKARPQLSTIEKLCRFFDCSPNDLLVIVPDIEPTSDSK
jgi:putative transcriptional regulator